MPAQQRSDPGRWPGHGAIHPTFGRTGTGTTDAIAALRVSPAAPVLARGESCPGQVTTAPMSSRGCMLIARHERRWAGAAA